jgi:hypothetical protein
MNENLRFIIILLVMIVCLYLIFTFKPEMCNTKESCLGE